MIFIILVYRYLESKFHENYFIQFLGASVIISIIDSILFYTLNFYSEANYSELMIGNIAGKVFVSIILSVLFAFYLFVNPQKLSKRKELKDIFTIINFTSGKR